MGQLPLFLGIFLNSDSTDNFTNGSMELKDIITNSEKKSAFMEIDFNYIQRQDNLALIVFKGSFHPDSCLENC